MMPSRNVEPPGVAEPAAESAVADLCRPASATVLNALCSLSAKLDDIDLSQEEPPAASLSSSAHELGRILRSAIEQLRALERLQQNVADKTELGLEWASDSRSGPRALEPRPLCVADACFGGGLELNRALQGLVQAQSRDDVLAAVETALRKLRRSICAVLDAAFEEGLLQLVGGEHLRQRRAFDLPTTLQIRRLYAEFRRSLRAPQAESREAVLAALRYAAGALATLMSSPHYLRARVSDRSLLCRLQERLLTWARSEQSIASGLQLLDDVRTCANLLGGINRRQELRAHDCALVEQLYAGPAGDTSEWLARFAPLGGLDDVLDSLLAGAADTTEAELVQQLLERLSTLRSPGRNQER
jgi:hypothetical protein